MTFPSRRLLPALIAAASGAALGATLGVAHASDQRMTLENEFLRITVHAGGKRAVIEEFTAKAQGRNLTSADSPVPMFQVDLYQGSKPVTLDPAQADELSLTRTDPQSLDLRAEFSHYGLTVHQTVQLKKGSPTASIAMRFRLTGRGSRIGVARMPGIGLLLDAGPETAAMLPVADGELLGNPIDQLRNGEKRTYNYPGMASAQLLAAYDRRGGLFCYATDGQGDFKLLDLARYGKFLILTFETVLYHQDPPEIAAPYTVEVGAFEGGWERAADFYKTWARKQAWCRKPLSERKLPADLNATTFSLAVNLREGGMNDHATNRIPEIPATVKSWSKGLGMPVNAILLSWEKRGPWIAPDYFPPYGGDDAFRGEVAALHKQGDHVTAFLSGYNVTLEKTARHGAPAFRADPPDRKALEAAAIIGQNGQIYLQGSAQEGTGRLGILCPSTPLAKQMIAEPFKRLRAFGVDRVQIDQVVGGGTPPCFSTKHGHPPVGGNSMFRATAGLLDSLADMDPAAVISLEEPGELFIPHVSQFHTRDYMEGYWPRDGAGVSGISLFNYLYHEFALGYGGDSAPISQKGEDPGVAIYAQAVNFINGRTPGAAEWMKVIPFDRVHESQQGFMQAVAAIWQGRAGRFLREGEMISLDAQDKMPWRLSGRASGKPFTVNTGKLLCRGYRLADGSTGLAYVNITGGSVPAPLRFAGGRARIAAKATVLWPTAAGKYAAAAAKGLKSGDTYVFPPYGILFLEASP